MTSGPLLSLQARSYVTRMNDILALPTGPLVDASLALVRSTESRPIVDHSVRTFLFARLLADHEGSLNDAAYDEELLFAATVMHDLGLGEHARGHARFEVEGADLAAAVLSEHGVPDADVDRVWEAIALHSSHGLAERRGLLTYLTYRGVFIDAGRVRDAVVEGLRKEVLNAYPKPTQGPYLAEAIIEHAQRSPAAAPPGSLGAYLLLQHQHG
jgi:HD domain